MGGARVVVNRRARLLVALAAVIVAAAGISVAAGRAADPPTVTLTGPAAAIAEGASGTFTITVDGDKNTPYDFNWALGVGASPSASSADFPSGGTTGGPVTVTTDDQGHGTATFNVTTADDQAYEPSDENFAATLSPGGARQPLRFTTTIRSRRSRSATRRARRGTPAPRS